MYTTHVIRKHGFRGGVIMNYIIILSDGRVFGGWNPIDGEMVILPSERKNLAYRMQRTLAMRTLEKVENYVHEDCTIEQIAA